MIGKLSERGESCGWIEGGVESDFREWLCMHYPDQLQTQRRDSARDISEQSATDLSAHPRLVVTR